MPSELQPPQALLTGAALRALRGGKPSEHRSEGRPLLPKLSSQSVTNFLGETEADWGGSKEEIRIALGARLLVAAIEGRDILKAHEVYVPRHRSNHPLNQAKLLRHPVYKRCLVVLLLAILLLPIWERHGSHSTPEAMIFEGIVRAIFLLHVLLNWVTFGGHFFLDKKWEGVFAVLATAQVVLYIGELLPSHSLQRTVDFKRLGQALSPYMLITQLETLRGVFANILRTMAGTRDIVATGLVFISFYAVTCVSFFNGAQVPGYDTDNDNFNCFGPALLSLYVLTTEENFPFVAEPALAERPLVGFIVFFSFILLFMILVLPLLLGKVLDDYAYQHAQRHRRAKLKVQKALLAAYYIIDDEGARGINEEQFQDVLLKTGLGILPYHAEILWDRLRELKVRNDDNSPGRGRAANSDLLRPHDFLALADMMDELRAPNVASPGEISVSVGSASATSPWAREIMRSYWFEPAIKTNVMVLVLLSILWTPSSLRSLDHCIVKKQSNGLHCYDFEIMHILEGIALMLFSLEILVKWMSRGGQRFLRASPWNVFDTFILATSLAAYGFGVWGRFAIPHYLAFMVKHHGLSDWIEMPRALRMLRVLRVFDSLRRMCDVLRKVAIVLMQIMLLYFCVSCSFAAIGVWMFDEMDPETPLPERYNFTTFSNALLSLFFMTVSNNWNDMLYPYIAEAGNRSCGIYFCVYMLFCSTIMLDILVGVVIEGFRVSDSNTVAPASSVASPVAQTSDGRGKGRSRYKFTRQESVSSREMFLSGLHEGITPEDMRELEATVHAIGRKLDTVGSWNNSRGDSQESTLESKLESNLESKSESESKRSRDEVASLFDEIDE
ncbi:unnamed protein product [Chrysoparadoxa australica]